ncbi:MAG: ribosome recycling factor [Patescibacteria group bacterium]|nr:ribosome recycling factor [Patescibacteria group bacterium]MCL5094190.1 ribosome recycling factor [Patescibacteria group bacterium]
MEELETFKKDLEKAVSFLEEELASLHTGRASVSLVNGIEVEAYGTKVPIKQVANISVSGSKTINIQPWDKSNLSMIEKSIRESDLNVSPINNGEMVIINLPDLTEERRKEFVRVAKEKAEEAKVTVRNHRHNLMEGFKKLKSDGSISEDEFFNRDKEVQRIVDEYNKKIDNIFNAKEKELLEV